LEKFRNEITGYGGAVSRGGANVIDGLDRGGRSFSRQLHQFWLDRFSGYGAFDISQADRNWGYAADGNANAFDHIPHRI
jgi:hypothetical protein